jgi:anti-anti-sigma regulatory factor
VVLCGLKPELKKIFSITSLDKIFKFFPNDVGALASFGVRL